MRSSQKILVIGTISLYFFSVVSPFTSGILSGNYTNKDITHWRSQDGSSSTGVYEQNRSPSNLFRLPNLPKRNMLKPGDEGPHFHRILPMREWWYYNVVFDKPDSELQNWSVTISFNHMYKSFEKPDIMFVTLFDNGNRTYGGMCNMERGVLQANGTGVNVTFENT
jgi:hypothetical protein